MIFTAIHTFTTKELLPRAERLGVAAAVALVLSIAWLSAEHESHDAVFAAGSAMASNVLHIILPSVQVEGRRS